MHTDELRAELAELAREVDAFPEELPAIRRRVARRRMAQASVATVLVVGLLVGVIATRSGNDHVRVAGRPKQVAINELPRVDALVGLPARASTVDIASMKGILDSADFVTRYAAIPRRFFDAKEDQGDFLANRDLRIFAKSVTFGVELDRSVPNAQRLLADSIGSAATVRDWAHYVRRSRGDEVEIFMAVDACSAQLDAVRVALARDPDVESYVFLSKQDALKEFKRLFRDEPALVKRTTADALPTSFRLRLRDAVLPWTLARRYEPRAGVTNVNTPANPFGPELPLTVPNEDRSACAPTP
jgi:hypothetical protein